ncbi:MAG: outer membrane protein transport protein [bacterium]|nr:outer membrane protein transport protein [bacterium]
MFKKGLIVFGVISVFCFSVASEGFSAAYEGPGTCVRPLTMGGAFVGLADDWSAIIWNPAGLTQLEGKGFGFSLDYVPAEASDGNSVANPLINNLNPKQGDIFFQLGGEPTSFDKTDVESTVYLPTVAGYTQFRGFAIGGAIYVPMGYASDWEDSKGIVQKATYKVESYEKIIALTAAKKITSNLSLGLGVNFLNWELEKKATKQVTAPVPYTYNFEISGDGNDFEGVVGLLYAFPNEKCSIGFVYRSGSKISVKGDAKTNYPLPPFSEEGDFNLKQQHPTTYAFGFAYKENPNLIFTADLNRTNWSKQKKEITFSQQGLFLNDKNESLGWKNVHKIRLGVEWTVNDAWKLRAGFFTDPSPIPAEVVSLTNMIDMDRKWYSLGAGYIKGDWQIDMGIQHNEGDRTVEGVNYEKECTSVHIATSRQF